MSRQPSAQINRAAGTVTGLGSRTVHQPRLKELSNLLFVRRRVTPSKILSHQFEPRLEQV
jgi:hypothetical protein